MSSLGLNSLGTSPLGGPGLIACRGVVILGNGSISVVFDVPPDTFDPGGARSAINPANYTLAGLDPSIVASNGDVIVPLGAVVPTYQPVIATATPDALDETQIVVTTDAPLQAGVRYQVTLSPSIRGAAGEVYFGPTVFVAPTPAPRYPRDLIPQVAQIEEQYRDFAYSIFPDPTDPSRPTLVYEFDANGDIALQAQRDSLRKRIIRRILTDPSGFVFLPGYGVGVALKRLIRAGELQGLASRIAEQVRREPDVTQAAASVGTVQRDGASFVIIEVFVVTTNRDERRILFDVPLSSTGTTPQPLLGSGATGV